MRLITNLKLKSKTIIFLFFFIFLIIGLFIFQDYGLSWDEKLQRDIGLTNIKYIFRNNQSLLNFQDRHYGPAFELVLISAEKLINPKANLETKANYYLRHLITFLSFYLGVIFFYLLLKKSFRNWRLGLLGALFLILSPRIFSHSFYNSKDIPFFSFFIISIYTLIKYLDNKKVSNAIIHGIICGFLIAIRISGIIVPLLTLIFCAVDFFVFTKLRNKNNSFLSLGHYLFILIVSTIIFWPFLWAHPLLNFIEAFKKMTSFPLNATALYLGKDYQFRNLPWHYIPLWIIITTPILYFVFFISGLLTSIKQFFLGPIKFYQQQKPFFILICWFFIPITMVILFRTPVYDEWRHLFFVYPALIGIAIYGFNSIYQKIAKRHKILPIIYFFIIGCCLLNISLWMIKNHPFQNLYFNRLAGKNMSQIKNKFELDYWGLSYRKALEYILKHDRNQFIKIYVNTVAGEYTSLIFPESLRKRLIYVDNPNKAKYFIGNYRWHKEDYPYKEEYYSLKIDNAKIVVIYKL